MQTGVEFVILSSLVTIMMSLVMSFILGRKWYTQEVRLTTDLPLVFAVSGIFQALNMLILTLPNIGVLEPTLELFKIRAMVIGGSTIPFLGALFQIWIPTYQKYHNKLLLSIASYLFLVALFGYSEVIIMTLIIPVLIIISLIMMTTFIITWKTGRLKEVRNELLVLAFLLMIASQLLRVPLMTSPLFYIPDVLLTFSMVSVLIAIINPWYSKELKSSRQEVAQLTAISC